MTSISALSSWNTTPTLGTGSGTNRTDVSSSSSSAASPSTIVALSKDADGPVMVPSPPAWERAPSDAVSRVITKNMSAYGSAGRFSGLGSALMSQFQAGVTNYSQATQQSPPRVQGATYGAVSAVQPGSLHGNGEDQMSLSITTKSGVEVKLSLDSQGDGLAVQMTSSGELSDEESKALAGLSDAFQKAIDGMTQSTPKLNLGGLMQFDQNVLSSVNLHAQVKLHGGQEGVQTLDFKVDDTQRKISFSGAAGKLDLNVDPSQAVTLGSKSQQAKALASYMKQFDQAATRGQGDTNLMGMFKDGFSALHSNISAPQADATSATSESKWRLAPGDKAILTGLADFSASVSQTVAYSNPMRSAEKDTFNYDVAQKTSISGSQDNRSIRQEQTSKLSASYHQSLVSGVPLKLTTASESQNYTYHQIEDTASSVAQVGYKDGKLVRASLEQASSQSAQVLKYFLGKLESDKTTPGGGHVQRDLMPILGPYRTGEVGLNDEQKEASKQQALLNLGDDVLLQSYPGQFSAT